MKTTGSLIFSQLGFFEVWLSRATKLSSPANIVFDDGTAVNLNQLETIYDVSKLNWAKMQIVIEK